MGKLVEATHVTLGGEVGSTEWAFPYPSRRSFHAITLATVTDRWIQEYVAVVSR